MITLKLTDEEARQLSAILDEFAGDCNDHIEDGQDKDEERRLKQKVRWANAVGNKLDQEFVKL